MNLGNGLTALTPPPEPPKPAPRPPVDNSNAVKQREQEFDRLIAEELAKKKEMADAAQPHPATMPWLQNQVAPVSGDDDDIAIEAASAQRASDQYASRAFSAAMLAAPHPTGGARPGGQNDEPNARLDSVAQAMPKDEAPKPVQVIVPPGLPPVQPVLPVEGEPVSLVQFPQVVAGTASQMVKDGKAITQLDFEINPPHVGPVTLNVSLQDRVVTVQLTVPTLEAKQMLEGQVGSIASILQAQNLTPGQVRIVTAAGGRSGAGAAGQQADPGQGGFGLLNGGRKKPSGPDDMTSGNL